MVQPSLYMNGLVFAINTWFKLAQNALRSPDLRYMDLGVLDQAPQRVASMRVGRGGGASLHNFYKTSIKLELLLGPTSIQALKIRYLFG